MKNVITSVILLVAIFGCTQQKERKSEQIDSTNLKLDGFWLRSFSQYKAGQASQQFGCPATDAPIEEILQPYALGSHLLIKEDSISLFRYPYAYYGTYKYEITGDSLFVKSDDYFTRNYSMNITNKDKLILSFDDEFSSTCILTAKAKYENFIPDTAIINKLIQDSISCDSLADKWWYLRKEITYEDGMDPTILNFPNGMPDSIFVSQEIISKDVHKPFIELELDNRIVKMFFKNPYEYSFTLTPEIKNDEVLFASFYEYEESIDTIYYDVIYQKN